MNDLYQTHFFKCSSYSFIRNNSWGDIYEYHYLPEFGIAFVRAASDFEIEPTLNKVWTTAFNMKIMLKDLFERKQWN